MNLPQYIAYSLNTRRGAAQFLVAIAWAYPLLYYVKAIVLRMPLGDELGDFVLPFIYIVLFLMGYSHITKSFRPADMLFSLFLITIYIIQYLLFPENEERINEFFPTLVLSLIPMYFIGTAIDIDQVYKPMYVMSIICVFLQAVNTLYVEAGERLAMNEEEIREQMNTAYRILPYVIFCFWGWLRKFNLIGFATSLLGLFLLVSYGSRGPVACTLLFVMLYVVLYKAFKGKWFVVTLLGVFAAFAFIYLEQFFIFLQGILSQFGLSTRIIDLAINEEVVTHVSGRDDLATVLMRKLQDAPFHGYGIGGTWKFVGSYAHNLFLDILFSFGIVPGTILLLSMFVMFYKGWRNCRTMEEKKFMLVLFCCFAKLFVSYTIFSDSSWMMMLGFCAGVLRRRKKAVGLSTSSKQQRSTFEYA